MHCELLPQPTGKVTFAQEIDQGHCGQWLSVVAGRLIGALALVMLMVKEVLQSGIHTFLHAGLVAKQLLHNSGIVRAIVLGGQHVREILKSR